MTQFYEKPLTLIANLFCGKDETCLFCFVFCSDQCRFKYEGYFCCGSAGKITSLKSLEKFIRLENMLVIQQYSLFIMFELRSLFTHQISIESETFFLFIPNM
jgi:hypothetical protein